MSDSFGCTESWGYKWDLEPLGTMGVLRQDGLLTALGRDESGNLGKISMGVIGRHGMLSIDTLQVLRAFVRR